MQEKNKLVEEALIQMRQVEEAIAENAKGILQSTMKEEISQLVKESLSEQDELEIGVEDEFEDESENEDEFEDEDDLEMGDFESDDDDEFEGEFEDDEVVDLTGIEDEQELLKVFKAMSEEDGIIVTKDGENIHLKDTDDDTEYILKSLDESMHDELEEMYDEELEEMYDEELDEEMEDGMSDEEMKSTIEKIFSVGSMEEEETLYEIEFDEETDEETEEGETLYEIEFDEEEEEDESYTNESYNHKRVKKTETKEGKSSIKPKGLGISKPKFQYKTQKGGFGEEMPEAFKGKTKADGTGNAKKVGFPKGENTDGKNKVVGKKTETKEAARSYAFGSEEGRGLRKGVTPNRNLKFESLEAEVKMLREKNEEYRKALNVFREKLNEVAIFNSNLAYATRLFTEHSTTKKEKINILRRFDNVETLKESKNLYKSIKDELSKVDVKPINESFEKKLNQTASTGSSASLIESKTYENPQFLRMKDLMSKII